MSGSLDPLPTTFAASVPNKEERTWALVAHLSAFAGHIFPFAHIIAPLVVWLLKKDTSAFVDVEGKEAVNAQISFTIYSCIAIALCFVLIGIPLLVGLYIANCILVIVAGVTAYGGRAYRYPFILRFLK